MTPRLRCDDVRALAPELALGVLDGVERGAVLTHLARCDACRELVADLARAADGVLLAAPAAEPPPGFESRVLERLAADLEAGPVRLAGRRRRRSVLAGAVAAVALVLLGAAGSWAALRPRGGEELLSAPMEDAEGDEVGEVYLFDGEPSWMFFEIDGWTPAWGDARYAVQVDLVDGGRVLLDDATFASGGGAWGSVVGVDVHEVRWVGVIDPASGRVYCGASLRDA
ncbi:MAG TPA: zf-HC2 domain-containing protein [Acidimicrobiales bacterium]|jgi:hypothetical protein